MLDGVDFDEAKQSQLPLVELLINMGYTYLSREEALAQRGGDTSKFLLADIARQSLMNINSYQSGGQDLRFSEADVAGVVDELDATRLEGLIDTSRDISHMIMPKLGGKTIEVFADGRRESKSFRYIDFSNGGKNNQFHVTVEYKVTGRESIRCDIVCFVNGIPLVVIENKKSSVDVSQAINQLRRYQKLDFAPKLFVFSQLLIATNATEWLYGTAGTPDKFYAAWREKDANPADIEQAIRSHIARPINSDVYRQLLHDLNGYTKDRLQLLTREIKAQDMGAYAMLRPERLLDIVKNFVFYDGPYKKIARYQQYFAVHKMLDRVHNTEHSSDGSKKRPGGIVWHTQGSGKSLTMVMFIRALIEDPAITNPRILVVTDRIDLNKQIKTTLKNAGLKKEVINTKSGEDLLRLIRDKNSAVITTLVHKFGSAARSRQGFSDLDENIFVLVDEAHRSHSGESRSEAISASLEMRRVIPNAAFIAFTGTPLLKREKSQHTWGNFIDRYTIEDALADKIILPLIYEGRYIPLSDDSNQIDRRWDRVSDDLTAQQRYIAEKKATPRAVATNPDRMREICYDIQSHYTQRFQGTGLKAQAVAPSKAAAVLMQRFFESEGKLQSALVISDESGETAEDDEKSQVVSEFLQNIKTNYNNLQRYEESVIESFVNSADGVEVLIVVDKLLTGFDAPRNTVLYLAKQLKDHNLLQAIARVNRLFDNPNPVLQKTSGFIIDYSENAANMQSAMELFSNYDDTDVQHVLLDVPQKIHELDQSYGELCDIFNGVAKDSEALVEHLREDPRRRVFETKLREFLKSLNECLSLRDFLDTVPDGKIDAYRRDAKKFQSIKKDAALRFGDNVDLKRYELELVKILDENIKASAAEILIDEIEITDRTQLDKAIGELGSNKSKAEAIAAQTERRISELREQDAVLYNRFSERIKEILREMYEKKLADVEAFRQLRLIADEVNEKKDANLPPTVRQAAGADILYRNLQDILPTSDSATYERAICDIARILHDSATVDWWRSFEIKRQMSSQLDDYLYEQLHIQDYALIEQIIAKTLNLAEANHKTFGS